MPLKTAIEIGSGLADSGDENEDASKWIERMRKKSKKKTKKIENAFDELDEAVTTDATSAGMKVMHSIEDMESALAGGTTQILTLQDTSLLDKTGKKFNEAADEDVLENVHLKENEKRAFNKRAAKKSNAYSDDEDGDGDGGVLPQYATSRTDFEKSRKFTTLNSEGDINVEELKETHEAELDAKAAADGKTRYSFQNDFTYGSVMNDTFNDEELAQFRKPKKKKMVRKRREKQPTEALQQLESELKTTTTAPVRKSKVEKDQLEIIEKLERRAKIQQEAEIERERQLAATKDTTNNIQNEEPETLNDDSAYVIDTTTEFTHGIGSVYSTKMEDLRTEAKEAEERLAAPAKPTEEVLTPEELAQQEERLQMLKKITLLQEPKTNSIAGTLEYIKQKGLLETSYKGRANDMVFMRDGPGVDLSIAMTDKYVLSLSFLFK